MNIYHNDRKVIGRQFDRLTPIERVNQTGKAVYRCKCICGNEVEVKGGYLTSKKTHSCGCLKSEKRKFTTNHIWRLKMKFNLFKQLYTEALEEAGLENYIERGWQDWMDDYSPNMVADLLTRIHTLANNPLKDTRGMSRAEFARTYNIPIRTLEAWDAGVREKPAYTKLLIDFAQFHQ